MRTVWAAAVLWFVIVDGVTVWGDDPAPSAAPSTDSLFANRVEPLLRTRCFSCHGQELQEGGLRLDVKTRALDGGDSGTAVVPGDTATSLLIRRVAGLDELMGPMPPEGEGTPLTVEEVELLKDWVAKGAHWPDENSADTVTSDHWSFLPIQRPQLPGVNGKQWPRNSIDHFILARLEAEHITPAPPANRVTLIRRLYLDLLGLPPTPADVDRFLSDRRPDAYEQLVDRLLSSPHFGERWTRHWLDLARYADSDGYEKDRPRPNAWRYRDWVLQAINADLPFDQFTIVQLAGDMLPDAEIRHRVATGFHRNTLHNTEGGIDPEEDRVKKTVDRTNTVGTIWMGLTVGCAQCHSHKYDPLTQREYYALYAFFDSLDEQDVELPKAAGPPTKKGNSHDLASLPLVARSNMRTRRAHLTSVDSKMDESAAEEETKDEAQTDRQAADKQVKKDAKTAVAEVAKAQAVVQRSQLRTTKIHLRGDFLSPGDEVTPKTPSFLPRLLPRGEQPDRLDLAHWLARAEHPLTARVTANRTWTHLFGRGLVFTVDDFGNQGELPSHPELLDWLAAEFSEQRWSVKRLVRLIVLSATYRQSTTVREELVDVDPENVWLARQSRRRMEAEIIRDMALSASGILDRRLGGPSVMPPQPEEYSKLTYANSAKWKVSAAGDAYRRGMYTFFQRTSPYPMLMTFDAPDSNVCCPKRNTSNTPLQALTIWNDRVFMECAQALGRRILADVPSCDQEGPAARQCARYAFRLCLSREPEDVELDELVRLYESQLALIGADKSVAEAVVGPASGPQTEDLPQLAAWVMVGRTLLNLDEFITRE